MRPLPVRTGLFVTMAFSLVLLYLIWWTAYTNVHYESRYTPQPPGAAAEVHGTSVRLLSLTQSDQLTEVGPDQPPKVPDPGAVWIVAELEAVRHGEASEFLCQTEVVGPQGVRWEPASVYVDRSVPSCDSTALGVGQPYRFEALYMVPRRYADQLAGIALPDRSTADRTAVLRPAAG